MGGDRGGGGGGWPATRSCLELPGLRTGLAPWGSEALSQSLCRPGIPLPGGLSEALKKWPSVKMM